MNVDLKGNPGQFVYASQAARELGVSRQRVHQLIESGRLPSVKSGHYRLISVTDLAAFKRVIRHSGTRIAKEG